MEISYCTKLGQGTGIWDWTNLNSVQGYSKEEHQTIYFWKPDWENDKHSKMLKTNYCDMKIQSFLKDSKISSEMTGVIFKYQIST